MFKVVCKVYNSEDTLRGSHSRNGILTEGIINRHETEIFVVFLRGR